MKQDEAFAAVLYVLRRSVEPGLRARFVGGAVVLRPVVVGLACRASQLGVGILWCSHGYVCVHVLVFGRDQVV